MVEALSRCGRGSQLATGPPVPHPGVFDGNTIQGRDPRPHQAIPLLQQIRPHAILQDDNATPHRARLVGHFLQQQGVRRMDWPACSPDLNPIENVWDHLDRQLRDNHPPPNTLQELLGYLRQEWQNLDQQLLRRMSCPCVNAATSVWPGGMATPTTDIPLMK